MKKQTVRITMTMIAIITMLIVTAGCSFRTQEQPAGASQKPKNIIFMIGDGMGDAYLTAHRYMKDNPSTKWMEFTAFDEHLTGKQMTYPEDHEQNVTDSSAAATAMATGVKTYNRAVGVDNDEHKVKSVLETAKEQGKATGLVATMPVTHATPASFGAHNIDRDDESSIADDYFDEKIDGEFRVDVLLGGGENVFERDDRNLIEEFEEAGYSHISTRAELLNNDSDQVLGLFALGSLPYAIDRPAEVPSLAEMTEGAIRSLSQDEDGFFLLVEGSMIDPAGHDNDIVAAMSDMADYEEAFKAAIEFAEKDGETLVVSVADHSTGGLSIGADWHYNWFPEPIQAFERTPDWLANEIDDGADVETILAEYVNLELTEEELASIEEAMEDEEDPENEIDKALEDIANDRSHTGWTSDGHTGEDVSVFSFGPGSERFTGTMDNTDQARNMFELLNADVIINDN